MVPEGVGDRGAGLVVGRDVGQVVVVAEGLALAPGADAAGEVELARDDVVPQAVERAHVVRVAGERGDVGHRRVQVAGAHRVADRLVLLGHRQVVLLVGPVERVRPPRPRCSRKNFACSRYFFSPVTR